MNFTDPSGYCFLGCFWKGIFKAIGKLFSKLPILGSILRVAAVALACGTTGGLGCGAVVGALSSAFVAGVTSGDLGMALKAGFIAAVTAVAFHAVGDITLGPAHATPAFGRSAHLANIAGHAAVGCGAAVLSGGDCGPGALSAAAGSAAGPLMTNLNYEEGLIAHSVVGGVASVAGGGKFANGAATAAFGYLFNNAGGKKPGIGHNEGPPLLDEQPRPSIPWWKLLLRRVPFVGIFVADPIADGTRYTVDNILKDPSLLEGMSPEKIQGMIGNTPGWINDVMRHSTTHPQGGWVFREMNARGTDFTGRMIQFHPGTPRHFGGQPYWKVSGVPGRGTVRIPQGP